ncbi:hypothetical protein HPHPH6_0866 [Helicobacter pylori Hp H-6]|uniref:Uncharacterized protein n=1 Tax=Helicobacter pylori Hp H-6 TaxID=992061 RepID=I9UU91_HELPX|nr:hypothetical protein HPHPH6_0866 [Helicobacter pylori Hp H-6]
MIGFSFLMASCSFSIFNPPSFPSSVNASPKNLRKNAVQFLMIFVVFHYKTPFKNDLSHPMLAHRL